MLITKLSCSDKAVKPRVCSSWAAQLPGAGESREAGKALGPSVGGAGAGSSSDRGKHLHGFSTSSSQGELNSYSHGWHKPTKTSLLGLHKVGVLLSFPSSPEFKNCKCPFSPVLQVFFFFPILPFTISINQGIFHQKVKLLNKRKFVLPENILYQLKRER